MKKERYQRAHGLNMHIEMLKRHKKDVERPEVQKIFFGSEFQSEGNIAIFAEFIPAWDVFKKQYLQNLDEAIVKAETEFSKL